MSVWGLSLQILVSSALPQFPLAALPPLGVGAHCFKVSLKVRFLEDKRRVWTNILKYALFFPRARLLEAKKSDFSLSQFFLWFLEQSLLCDVFELPLLQIWGAMQPFK